MLLKSCSVCGVCGVHDECDECEGITVPASVVGTATLAGDAVLDTARCCVEHSACVEHSTQALCISYRCSSRYIAYAALLSISAIMHVPTSG